MGFLQRLQPNRASRASLAVAAAAPASVELDSEAFTQWLDRQAQWASGQEAGFALLVVNLRRSDRAAALMRRPAARACDGEVTRRLSDALRPQDRFTRLGSDHLAIVLPGIADPAVVMLAAGRISGCFEAPIEVERARVRMRPCVGCALFQPNSAVSVEALLSAADHACTAAASSANGFALAESPTGAGDDAETMFDDFEAALRANELEVWFQPQQDIGSGVCVAAEALLRWRHKRLDRMIPPPIMVEMAESQGLMSALTTFVLNTSLRQLSELRRDGIDLRIAVNTPPSQLHDVELPELVAGVLQTWSIPADRLIVEVTENAFMVDFEQSLQVMHALKDQGVGMSIDDFGTGYSSLAYLQRMPVDELKIDKIFVQNMLENRADEQIVRSVIDLAHNFDLEAVAEGVDNDATLDMLARLGCNRMQGYLYAHPMPSADVPGWWARRRR